MPAGEVRCSGRRGRGPRYLLLLMPSLLVTRAFIARPWGALWSPPLRGGGGVGWRGDTPRTPRQGGSAPCTPAAWRPSRTAARRTAGAASPARRDSRPSRACQNTRRVRSGRWDGEGTPLVLPGRAAPPPAPRRLGRPGAPLGGVSAHRGSSHCRGGFERFAGCAARETDGHGHRPTRPLVAPAGGGRAGAATPGEAGCSPPPTA